MQANVEPMKLVTVIVSRAKAKKVIQALNENDFRLHSAFLGRGTAPSDIIALLGLGEPEKCLIFLLATQSRVKTLFSLLESEFEIGHGGGIAFTTPLNSVSNMEVVKLITGLN